MLDISLDMKVTVSDTENADIREVDIPQKKLKKNSASRLKTKNESLGITPDSIISLSERFTLADFESLDVQVSFSDQDTTNIRWLGYRFGEVVFDSDIVLYDDRNVDGSLLVTAADIDLEDRTTLKVRAKEKKVKLVK